MNEHESISYNERPQKMLTEILKTVRRPTRRKYLQMLLMASNPSGATMNEISLKLEERPQTIHPLLGRMIERKALTREKRNTEFYYHLVPSISKEEIESSLKAIADEDSVNTTSLLDLDDAKRSIESQFDSSQDDIQAEEAEVTTVNTQEISSEGDREATVTRSKDASLAEILIKKLPEFDPSWNEEMQAKWFTSYEKLISLGGKGNY